MKKNKLIYVLNHYSKGSSSHFNHVITLLEEIAIHGVEIALIIEKADDIPIIRNRNISIYTISSKNKFVRFANFLFILKKLTKNGYKKIFIRISSISMSFAILFSWFYRLETYYWLSGTVLEQFKQSRFNYKKIKSYFKSRLPYVFVKNYVDHFVTGPESMVEYYVEVGKVKREKIIVLYNDIDISRFKKSVNSNGSIREQYDISVDSKIILFVHRFSPVRKSLFYLPYIIEKFYNNFDKKYTFVLVGGGPERNMLYKLLLEKNLTDKVKLLGNIPNNEIHALYQEATIFINPTYAEGFPRVLIEAMATGLPIVTTDAGGIKDILGERQLNFMVSKDDRDAFVNKMIELVNNENIQIMLSSENIDFVKKYSTQKVAQMYIDKIFRNEA